MNGRKEKDLRTSLDANVEVVSWRGGGLMRGGRGRNGRGGGGFQTDLCSADDTLEAVLLARMSMPVSRTSPGPSTDKAT